MTKHTKMDLKTAELLSKLPEPPPAEKYSQVAESEKTDAVVRKLEDYPSAIVHAQMNGDTSIEVSAEVYAHPRLGGGVKGNSYTTGNPGVRVFKEGTRDGIEKNEKLNAEAFHEAYMAEMRGEAIERERRGQ